MNAIAKNVRPAVKTANGRLKKIDMPKPNVFIGADPSFRKGGFWVCLIDRDMETASFFEMADLGDWALFLNKNDARHVLVENSNLQPVSFDMTGTAMVVVKKARDVGKNMAISQSAADIARKFTKLKPDISPKQKGAKIEHDGVFQGLAKSESLRLVNYKGLKKEQDKRDAFMLALRAESQWKTELKINKILSTTPAHTPPARVCPVQARNRVVLLAVAGVDCHAR